MTFEAIEIEPIKAEQERLSRIFSDEFAFTIPAYQRPYAWEVEHACELLDDVEAALEETQDMQEPTTYFLGSIVLIKQPGSPDAQVIDGQQRLTTLTILIATIRDLSEGRAAWKRHGYICEEGDSDRGTRDRFRLAQRKRDEEFFRKAIQDFGATKTLPNDTGLADSRLRMVENARHFRERLSAMSAEARDELMAFLLQRCYLVVIAVATPEMAHRVFTVLNARGLDLTPTDILKADLLDRAPSSQEQLFADHWETMEESLGREKFVDLFQHIRLIYQRDKPRERLEVGFKKFVGDFSNPEAFMDEVLGKFGEVFLRLQSDEDMERHYGARAARLIGYLRRLDNSDWLPPAILFLAREGSDLDKVELYLTKLERLAYFMFVLRINVNNRIARYAKIVGEVDSGWHPESAVSAVELTNDEKVTFSNALDGNIYELTRVRLPLMLRLDSAMSSGGATYQHDSVSVEHVLPQNPSSDSSWAVDFPVEEMRRDWTHRLGNLVLLTRSKNAQASNWDFDRKKREYFSTRGGVSPFVITTKVLEQTEWTPTVLRGQQDAVIKVLTSIWQLPLPSAEAPSMKAAE